MYYARDLFVKRGPLGTIWLAGNFLRKVSKLTILSSDVTLMCGSVLHPPVALALPAQSTLLRGVCRIENKKAVYLLDDALEAKVKLHLIRKTKTTMTERLNLLVQIILQ